MASLQKVTLTIANGGTDSNALNDDQLRNCRSLTIIAPDTLTGVVTVQTGDLKPNEIVAGVPGTVDFTDVQSPPGTDVWLSIGE
jgi:hypothetical protein